MGSVSKKPFHFLAPPNWKGESSVMTLFYLRFNVDLKKNCLIGEMDQELATNVFHGSYSYSSKFI